MTTFAKIEAAAQAGCLDWMGVPLQNVKDPDIFLQTVKKMLEAAETVDETGVGPELTATDVQLRLTQNDDLTVKELPIIVCAAIKFKNGPTVAGIRHYDQVMSQCIINMGADIRTIPHEDRVQGFLDNYGKFYTREAALESVKANGQPFNAKRNKCSKRLYSEGLY